MEASRAVNHVANQIRHAMEAYSPDADEQTAMLSGMSLVATYLAKLDGSREFTAATVLAAVGQVAAERNLVVTKLPLAKDNPDAA